MEVAPRNDLTKPSAADGEGGYGEETVKEAGTEEVRTKHCAFLAGCYGMLVMGFYCFIIVPAGAILIIHGLNKSTDVTLGPGIGLLIVFVIVIPILYAVWKCCCRKNDRKPSATVSPASSIKSENLSRTV